MAIWKKDGSTNSALSAKKGDPSYLQIVKSGQVDYIVTARTLTSTYIGHYLRISIEHNLPSSFFTNACPEISANIVLEGTDVVTGETMVSFVQPWEIGGLLYTNGTNTAWIRRYITLNATHLNLYQFTRRTGGSYSLPAASGTVQWKIMNPNPSGAIGGMGGGPGEPASSMYYYYDVVDYDDLDNIVTPNATGSAQFGTDEEAYSFA
jgi:hypothetical protein